jgi:TolB-like protein
MSDGRSRSTTGASRSGLSAARFAGARLVRGCVLFGLIGCALFAGIVAGPAAAADSAPKLLLLPVLVHSAEDPTYLREGLDDMLTARLERIGALALIEPDPNMKGTTQLARAREMGRRLGADYVLFGSFTRFGQGASLDVQCAPTATGRGQEPLREIFVHSGSIGDIIPDLDELAGKVSRFAHGEAVASSPAGARPAVAVSARDYQTLLGRVTALEKSLADLEARPKKKDE